MISNVQTTPWHWYSVKMSPRFVLGRENVPCAEALNKSLKADCTDFTEKWLYPFYPMGTHFTHQTLANEFKPKHVFYRTKCMAKWRNLERVWSSWNIFQLSSLKMLNFLTTFDKQFCGSTKPGDYYDKFMVLSAPSLPPTLISQTETQRIDQEGIHPPKSLREK